MFMLSDHQIMCNNHTVWQYCIFFIMDYGGLGFSWPKILPKTSIPGALAVFFRHGQAHEHALSSLFINLDIRQGQYRRINL